MSDPPLPLAGLRALEFTQNVMGPSGGLVLADLGADVVKVEPLGGDVTRALGGFGSGFFNYFARNKRSLAIDLKSDAGRAVMRRVVARADIVLENYAPGTMERLGCGYDALSGLNPRLIYCSLKGYLSGPYEN
ncbi:MAG TPA: CoA transferase, partial [Stellaceae bacterium]|nr:CoA transferase [Stellaceae bacterium]